MTHNTEFEISAADMADPIGRTESLGGSYYAQLKRATDELVHMTVRVDEYHDGRKRQKRHSLGAVNII